MPQVLTTTTVPDRRQRFRSFMKRFNPTAPTKVAIGEGLICQQAGRSVFNKLAAGADLAPGSQQLVVGGIGSGKTTELLLAERELSAHEHTRPVYIDVAAETDLNSVNSGALLASLGLRVWSEIVSKFEPPDELKKVYEAIKNAAYGYEKTVWEPGPEPDFDHVEPGPEPDFNQYEPGNETDLEPGYYRTITFRGKLKPPFPALLRDVRDLGNSLSKLAAFLKTKQIELVAIFDGLDRLIKADRFWSVAEQDLRAVKHLEISILVAGPLSIMYGQGRQVKDYFDQVHYLAPAVADPKTSPFLLDVLRIRGAEELMDPAGMERLCLASGGVLRDLISLARNAGENAYLDDSDSIEHAHVNRAIEQLGNSYLLGLGTRQETVLRDLMDGGGFAPSDSDSIELLITRRVLEQSESRYEVHPALATVLQRPSGSPG